MASPPKSNQQNRQNQGSSQNQQRPKRVGAFWKFGIFSTVGFNAFISAMYMSGTWEKIGSVFDGVILDMCIGAGVLALVLIATAFDKLEDQ